ncbi:mannosyltransferase [Labedella gwakjiensis]|uniref:Mannosyltransferase n=1 Tax=Labedella gwakjiensis TaxID=390269 RepID=A0A2P8GRM6_9MICO|nr:glycosyltransferase family 39 protein [Labedella gwakjiensis]PSL36618.1 mannosyltransferase [Labedella gwakjiensis]RUQ85478.1 hypothetical protein ELQ93_00005 [Labedella gwakjiensis]
MAVTASRTQPVAPGDPSPSARRRVLLPAILGVIAVVLSSIRSADVSSWTDEAITVSAATRSWSELWEMLQNIDAVHGVYYAFMHVWIGLFGASEFAIRFPSALAVGGAVVGTYVLGRRFGGERLAVVGAVVTMLLPRLLWAGIEGRPFAFTAVAAVWATVALARALDTRNSAARWALYAILAAVGVLLNVYLALLVVGHLITVVILHRTDRRVVGSFVGSAIVAAVLSAPVILLSFGQRGQVGSEGDRSAVGVIRRVLLNQWFLGETPDDGALPGWFDSVWRASGIVLAVVGIALMAWLVLRSRSARPSPVRELLAYALPWMLVSTLVVAAYTIASSPMYSPRYFTFTVPAVGLLIAAGLLAVPRRVIRWSIAVIGILAVTAVYASQRADYSKSGSDWSTVAEVVEAAEPGDAVYFMPRYEPVDGTAKWTARRIEYVYPEPFQGLDDITLRETGAETGTLDGESDDLDDVLDRLDDEQVVWVIYGDVYPADMVADDLALIESLGFTASSEWSGPRNVVVRYER